MDFRAKQEAEAVERMKLLELYPTVIKEFVKDFEDETNAVVYHIIKTYTTIGCMLSIFYVSDDEAEWESDREDMKIGEQLCYVKNIDNDDCSEFGYICFKKNCGGLMRIA